jgi:thiol-disulfide isomerase/thioredoxin
MKRFKKIIFLMGVISLTPLALKAQKKTPRHFIITVDVSNVEPAPSTVYLNYYSFLADGMKGSSDSATVKNGIAIFKGIVDEPTFAILQTKMFGESGRFILTDNVFNIRANRSITDLAVQGSALERDFESMMERRDYYSKELGALIDRYQKAMKANKPDSAAIINSSYNMLKKTMDWKVYRDYIETHAKTSALSVFALGQYSETGLSGKDTLYNLLAPAFKKFPTAIIVKSKIDMINKLEIGKVAPGFDQPDTSGHIISLSSFRGKYVLVDFWASWCHPCREESPYLLKAYQKYHDKKFDILAVSLDNQATQGAWMTAIHHDSTSVWTQVSDLKGWKNAASTLYGIRAIPQNYLLDPEGKIIATNLRGDDLEKKLSEILGEM